MEFVDWLASQSDVVHGKHATDGQIATAESELGVTFADEYRAYLRSFGSAIVGSHELSGISAAKHVDVVRMTAQERIRNPQVPPELYVLENVGIDGLIVWQDGSGKVYQSLPGVPPSLIARSILEYLNR